MKKFLIVSLFLLIGGISCKKNELCACISPGPLTFNLLLKDQNGADLLDSKNVVHYETSDIELTWKDKEGQVVKGNISVIPPSLHRNQELPYHLLGVAYGLKYGDRPGPMDLRIGKNTYKLEVVLTDAPQLVDQILVDKNIAPRDTTKSWKYAPVFHLIMNLPL